ncbi:MAG: M48 family metalloprotease [Candidatus Bathyarchaeota archaeon]|nr:M48 family metalloprotease [Candidatus Bathyarchaeota archaeon]MDH5712342.1 M48 family metalloprotease [Candidatus Bathyarchaeota archaeon]
MARLGQLKVSMTIAILLVTIIFSAFLLGLLILFRLPLIISIPFTLFAVMIYILLQYLIGPAMVRWSTRLRYLKPGEHPWLETTVKDLAEKGGISPPKLAIVPDQTPNAFVFGRTARGATLAVHEGLLKQLNQAEIRGVIGHELGHIKHKDFVVMTVLSALPLIAYLIAQLTFRAALYTDGGGKKEEGARIAFKVLLAVAAAISFIVYIATLLCVMRLSRLREHFSDAYSAYVTREPSQLQSALTKITYGLSLSPRPPHGARTLYIGDPALAKQECQGILQRKEKYDLDKDGVLDERELELAMEREAKSRWTTINTWFATHPATYQRILLLREIEKEMASGQYSSERTYVHI